MSRKLRVKMYVIVMCPVLLHLAGPWTLRKMKEMILTTTEMKMMRQIKKITLLNRQRNEDVCTNLKVDYILEKVQQARLRWCELLLCMKEQIQVKQGRKMEIKGERLKGRPTERSR